MNFETLETRRLMTTALDDIVEIRDNYGQDVEQGTQGDFDKNGKVDFNDFLVVANKLKTLYLPVKWSIPDQRRASINRILENGIAKMSISVTNKNGTFKDTCEVLLDDLKTTNTQCKIVVDATDLQADDGPWSVTIGFERQQISLDPSVSIATVKVERFISPALLLGVKSNKIQLGVTDFRGISVRPYIFISP